MPESDVADEPDSVVSNHGSKRNHLRIRWLIGFLAAFSGAALAIASYWYAPVRICHTNSECEPWGVVELTPFLVVALLAILPDLSEMSIGNVVSLKRRIDIQQGELDLSTKRHDAVERQVLQLSNNVSTNQQVTQQFFNLPAGSATHLPDAVNKKRELLDGEAHRTDATPNGTQANNRSPLIRFPNESYISDYSPEDAITALSLIEQWEELSRFVSAGYLLDNSLYTRQDLVLTQARRNFNHLFAEEIDMVRSVRNSIAHAKYVPVDDLRGALAAAQELNQILLNTRAVEIADL